jgi:hypothetical protein
MVDFHPKYNKLKLLKENGIMDFHPKYNKLKLLKENCMV